MIRIKKITKRFGDLTVLDSFSHDLKKGKITALVGSNGAGKTTLFNIIIGIVHPNQGSIYFQDKKITGLRTYQISNLGISMLFQQNIYFKNLTIKDHLVLCQNNKEKIKQVLHLVELNKPLNSLIYELSYGQKKLLGLAMTLLKKHRLLLLDEPVAGVNPALKNKIKKILLRLKNKGETIFLVEHDMDFIRRVADEIIVLDNGKIIDKGNFEKIMQNKQVRKSFIGVET